MVLVTSSVTCVRNPETRVKTVNQYTLGEEVGRGTYCKVRWARDGAGRCLAVKAFSKTVLERQFVSYFDEDGPATVPLGSRIEEERRILGRISHKHICALEEVIDDPGFETLYLVYEGLRGGQLMRWNPECNAYHVRSDPLDVRQQWCEAVRCGDTGAGEEIATYQEPVARHLLRQLLQATAYLHEQGVVHKDLKPDNILLSLPVPTADRRFVRLLSLACWPNVPPPREVGPALDQPAAAEPAGLPSDDGDLSELMARSGFLLKVSDFNTAVERPQPDCRIYDAEGTHFFTPPECFAGHSGGILGKPRDVWSVGCVLFTMLFGRTPYWAEVNLALQILIMQDAPFDVPAGVISQQAEELIRGLTAREPPERLTAAQALGHSWLS
uniref:Protein kinase domain-containing protein n=1 Tax=Alexandrium monilatum TaxID=311494 RepID=A0A7S4T5T3_9DINO